MVLKAPSRTEMDAFPTWPLVSKDFTLRTVENRGLGSSTTSHAEDTRSVREEQDNHRTIAGLT